MFYYSKNCYLNYFYDQANVQENILTDITDADDQVTIYTDPKYGMNDVQTLSIWTAAYLEQDGYMFTNWVYQPQ